MTSQTFVIEVRDDNDDDSIDLTVALESALEQALPRGMSYVLTEEESE